MLSFIVCLPYLARALEQQCDFYTPKTHISYWNTGRTSFLCAIYCDKLFPLLPHTSTLNITTIDNQLHTDSSSSLKTPRYYPTTRSLSQCLHFALIPAVCFNPGQPSQPTGSPSPTTATSTAAPGPAASKSARALLPSPTTASTTNAKKPAASIASIPHNYQPDQEWNSTAQIIIAPIWLRCHVRCRDGMNWGVCFVRCMSVRLGVVRDIRGLRRGVRFILLFIVESILVSGRSV